jgi:hypothetical protein
MATFDLKITYTPGRELASWDFNNQGAQKCCEVAQGDIVNVSFEGTGELTHRIMLCGQLAAEKSSSPFIEGDNIDLKTYPVLHVGEHTGRWGFSVSFTARNADASTSFYYVPDPEVVVSTRPGSDE